MDHSVDWDIRPGTVLDAQALAVFGARTFSQSYGHEHSAQNMQAYLAASFSTERQRAQLVDPTVSTLLAHDNTTLLGYAQIRRGSPPECVVHPDCIELHRFYVDQPLQGRGLAQALMSDVFRVAQGMGGHSLWLGVWERNQRAIAFYQKAGYADVGRIDFTIGEDVQTDRVLLRELSR